MATLIIYDKDGKREIELEETNSLGRLPDNRIQLNDPLVSKNHCLVISDQSGGYRISDLDSRNGTYLNKQRVQGDAALRNGDEITLGMTSCVFLSKTIDDLITVDDDQSQILVIDLEASKQTRFVSEREIQSEKTLRADYEKLRVAIELQRDIGLELDLNRIFNRILASTFEFLDCDTAVIMMADAKGEMGLQAFRTRRQKDKLVMSSTMVRRVRQEKVGIITADAMSDERFQGSKSIITQRVRSSMAVPILGEEKLLGIMIIQSSSAIMAYTEQDLSFFTNIAHQTAQLIKMSDMAKRIEEDAITREKFQRLLSPDLAELVVSGKLKVEKGGENRIATVLFADIRGFTSMCENMEAAEVLHMLNEYFEIMVEIAFRYEGTVDKFMGDMIMVVWGAPAVHPDDPIRAVQAAFDMQMALDEYNKNRDIRYQREIHIGIGINTGELVAGYIGSSLTMNYSVVGDAVNVASRLCSVARPDQILVSENTYQQVRNHFETTTLDPVRVKGKSKPVKAYGVLRAKGM
jgi:adenylate cyclase